MLVAEWIGPDMLRWALGALFIGMAGWVLIPDRADDEIRVSTHTGAFVAALVSFFLVEIGDKTQLATVALAARFQDIVMVTAGTTLGMLLADVPAVLAGHCAADKLPLVPIRCAAAALFAVLGVAALCDLGGMLGL